MLIVQWLSGFLSKRGLKEPDNRPLFAYKTTSDEFESLKNLLHASSNMQGTYSRYSQVWLLFAAEWWKREYAGGAWRWGPLCDALGQQGLAHEKIRGLVVEGHKQWQLQTAIKNEGKRFIGLVAVNGGLPMRLVESAQGGLSNLLRMVIGQAMHYQLPPDQMQQAIEAQAALLPSCYQQVPVYELLENLIQALLYIRKTYQLQGTTDPIVKLQEVCPDWAELFPLALDNQAAASLIKGLVRDVVGIAPQSKQVPFKVLRGLRFNSDGSMPIYELSFAMQAQAKRDKVAEALGIAADTLPPQFQLLLRTGEQEYLVGEALLRGDEYQLIARPLPPIKTLHTATQLIVSRWGATLHIATLPGGEALSHDEPLIFENTFPFARLLAQGDALVKGQSALVAIPAKTVIFPEDGEVREICQNIADGLMLLELPAGKTRLTYLRQSFIVTVSDKAVVRSDAYWQGDTLEAISVPGLLFKGIPRLRIGQGIGDPYAPHHELYARSQSSELPLTQAKALGLCRLIWRKDGQRLLSTRAILLPENASINYVPGNGTYEGQIQLVNWPNVPIYCEDGEIKLESTHDGNSLHLNLKCSASRPATSVPLCLHWSNGEQKLTLPFPGYGVALLKNQNIIKSNHVLTLEELIGCRALLMSAQGAEHWLIRLSAVGPDGHSPLAQDIHYTGVREIRLFELIPAISQILSCYPGLDHFVQLELVHVHQIHTRLQIGRYSTRISLRNLRQRASLTNGERDLILDRLQAEGLLLALPLAKPELEPISLPIHLSEQEFTGSWMVDLPEDTIGPWLIYAVDSSLLHCRPAVIPSTSKSLPKTLSPLRQALCEDNAEERMKMLRRALHSMATAPDDKDWQTLEVLLDKVHHLPLASLDICQALIREPLALVMATLLLDNFSSRMVERLPSELPFEWLLIAPNQWIEAFAILRKQLAATDNRLISLLRNDIQNKSLYLSRWQPALRFIFEQGLYHHFDLESRDVSFFLKNPLMLADSWLSQLFDGENSAMQQMFRRNSLNDQPWPVAINVDFEPFLKTTHGMALLSKSKLPINEFKLKVVMLPFMAAFDTYFNNGQQWQLEPSRLFSLRNARLFDAVWFDAAYEAGLTMAQADLMRK